VGRSSGAVAAVQGGSMPVMGGGCSYGHDKTLANPEPDPQMRICIDPEGGWCAVVSLIGSQSLCQEHAWVVISFQV
jgi:hypothetical protein